MLREDENAVLDMPFRLAIGLLSLALVVPAVLGGWSSLDYVQTEQRIRSEISRVLAAGQRFLQAGSGGETIEVSLRGGTFTRIEYVALGDAAGSEDSRTVRYRLTGGQEQIMSARNPSVALYSPDGGRIRLLEGVHTLMIECVDGVGITVRLV